MDFIVDLLIFLVAPYLCWRVLRGAAPMAVLPILIGLCVAVAAYHFDFDKSIAGPSEIGETIGWVGVLILTFSAGLETRTMAGGPKLGAHLFLSAGGALALPFLVGFLIALSGVINGVLQPPANVSPMLAAAALGLCIAVSALPVLVGVVRELPAADRTTGNVALRIAALDDAILWVGLAAILFFHLGQQGGFMGLDWRSLAGVGVFVAMAVLRRVLDKFEPKHWLVAAAIGALYLIAGAWSTGVLGLHELLGAYFAGALTPVGVARRINPELVGKVALFGLSPLFFGHRGLSIDGSVITPAALGVAVVLLIVAAGSKMASLYITPPEPTMSTRERTRLGVLLQCKGLMEIVAASILFEHGLIGPETFAILVTLAIVSTTLTAPLFRLVSRWFAREPAVSRS
jgi:Kef-type K+ transport system membrane component KefB